MRRRRPEVVAQIEQVISDSSAGASGMHDLRTRHAGHMTFIEFHLTVSGRMTVSESHAICDRIEAALERAFDGARVTIHVEPDSDAMRPRSEMTTAAVARAATKSEPDLVRALQFQDLPRLCRRRDLQAQPFQDLAHLEDLLGIRLANFPVRSTGCLPALRGRCRPWPLPSRPPSSGCGPRPAPTSGSHCRKGGPRCASCASRRPDGRRFRRGCRTRSARRRAA